jgi:hypothetical protein
LKFNLVLPKTGLLTLVPEEAFSVEANIESTIFGTLHVNQFNG